MSDAGGGDWEDSSPERLYVITGAAAAESAPIDLDLVTLIVAKSG